MRGLDHLITLRRKGVRPPAIVLQDGPYEADVLPNWLQLEPGDVPELTDLRALVGMIVSVHGRDAGMVERWARAAVQAGASTVLTMYYAGSGEAMQAAHGTLRINGVDQ